MPLQPCPIVGAFLAETWLYMNERPGLHDDLIDEYNEVSELAGENYPDVAALNLRGLYIVEDTYHRLLPAMSRTLGIGAFDNCVKLKKFARSVEGMQGVVEYADELREETEVESYSLELSGKTDAQIQEWIRKQANGWELLLSALTYAAAKMEHALRGGSVYYKGMGTGYALCCIRAGVEVEDCLDLARLLLRINLENGPHPWNQ